MLLSQSEKSPYLIKKSKKQGWRVWIRDTNHYTQKVKYDYRKLWSLDVRVKYRCIKGKFKTPYEADMWGRNYMFKTTLDKSYLHDS